MVPGLSEVLDGGSVVTLLGLCESEDEMAKNWPRLSYLWRCLISLI